MHRLKGQSAEDLFNELQSKDKSNPQLILNRIQSLDLEEDRNKHLKTQITLANEVLDQIKINELIASFAIQKHEKKENNGSNGSNGSLKK